LQSGKKKSARFLITTALVVIFILGAGIVMFNKIYKKPVKLAQVVANQADVSKIPGWWFEKYFGSVVCEKETCKEAVDADHDGLTNLQEFYYHTDPLSPYTVKDKLNDGQLVAAGFDPSRPGHMTFDQVIAPANIIGESLLVTQDIKDLIAEQNDISKVNLPLVKDSDLKVVTGESADVYQKYFTDYENTVRKYFSQSDFDNIKTILKSGSGTDSDGIKARAGLLAGELKNVSVPQKLALFHKYNIAFYQLVSEVLISAGQAFDPTSSASDIWYEKVQSLMAISQKISFEKERLISQLHLQP